MRWTPKPYQIEDLRFLRERPYAGYFADMGSGKTSIILELIRTEGLTALVLCPKKVAELTWPMEMQKWDQFQGMVCSSVLGTAKQREEAFKADADVFVMNYENIP